MVKTVYTVTVPGEGHRGGSPIASVYHVSFTKILFSNLYGIAVSNILIFMLGTPASFLGVASALNALAYFVGPLVFQGLSIRAGIKRTIFAINIVDLALMLIVSSVPAPSIIIAMFFISGFSNSVFWANMAASIHAWQDWSPEHHHGTIYRRYVASWISGGIASEMIGVVVIAFGFDDRFVLAVSIALAIVQLPLSYRVSLPPIDAKIKEERKIMRAESRKHESLGRMLVVPVCFMILAEISVQMIRGTYDFLYPFIVREDGGSTALIYIMSLLQRFAYMSGIFVSSKLGIHGQHAGAMMGLGIATILAVNTIIAPMHLLFAFAVVFSDFATGLIYGYSSQVLLRYSKKGNALRLASLYETASGAGYGVTVILAGLGGDHDVRLIFIGLSAFLAVAFAVFAIAACKGSTVCNRFVDNCLQVPVLASGISIQILLRSVYTPVDAPSSSKPEALVMLLDTAKK
ncbi:MAG: MFS transporter [Candidatus Sigynarchaeota archaeon]